MPATFSDQIKILAQLQSIDAQAHDLKKALAEQPAVKKRIEGEFEKKKASYKLAEEVLKTAQLRQKEKEIGLQSLEDKIQKMQSQLYQLKSNKEYQAMEMEIKGGRADKSVLEEEILKLFDAVDDAKKKLAKEKEALAAEEKKFKDEIAVVDKEIADLQQKISVAEENRKQYLPNIDPKILGQYERLLKNRDGLALVPVKGGSCSGCNMELPPQMVNEVHANDKLIYCESCARILYWNS
jgi:predicted  nucleic acid-binding Zn-ribbon protein